MKLTTSPEVNRSLAELVERVVQTRTSGMIHGLHVDAVGKHVVLSGRTSTYYAKQLATHAAMAATDVEDVRLTNDIEVC